VTRRTSLSSCARARSATFRIERAVDAGPTTSGTWRRHHNVKVSVARRSSGMVWGGTGVGLVGRMCGVGGAGGSASEGGEDVGGDVDDGLDLGGWSEALYPGLGADVEDTGAAGGGVVGHVAVAGFAATDQWRVGEDLDVVGDAGGGVVAVVFARRVPIGSSALSLAFRRTRAHQRWAADRSLGASRYRPYRHDLRRVLPHARRTR